MDHQVNNNSGAPLETLEKPWRIFFIILYSLTALIAFTFNSLTIVVLIKGRRCQRCDLRSFQLNLAIVDLITSIFIIPTSYINYLFGRFIFPPVTCPLINVTQLSTITISIYILVAIAIDRYLAVHQPLRHLVCFFKRQRTVIIGFIWIFGASIGLTQLWVTQVNGFSYDGKHYLSCDERWPPESMPGQLYTGFIFIVTFALPVCLLVIVYSALTCRLWRYRIPGQSTTVIENGCDAQRQINCRKPPQPHPPPPPLSMAKTTTIHSLSTLSTRCLNVTGLSNSVQPEICKVMSIKRNKVLRMVITIIVVFTACWLPIQIFGILIYFWPNFLNVNSSLKYNVFVFSYFAAHWISCAHAAINSIIYSFMSQNFREDIKDLFDRLCLRISLFTYISPSSTPPGQYSAGHLHSKQAPNANNGHRRQTLMLSFQMQNATV